MADSDPIRKPSAPGRKPSGPAKLPAPGAGGKAAAAGDKAVGGKAPGSIRAVQAEGTTQGKAVPKGAAVSGDTYDVAPPPANPPVVPPPPVAAAVTSTHATYVRRRGTPSIVWVGIAVGVLAVGGLAYVVMYDPFKKPADRTARHDAEKGTPREANANAPDAKSAEPKPHEKSAEKSSDQRPIDDREQSGSSKEKPSDKSAQRKKPDDRHSPRKRPDRKRAPTGDGEKKPAPNPEPRVLEELVSVHPLLELAPEFDAPPELMAVMNASVELLDNGKFEEFLEKHTYPPAAEVVKSASPFDDLASRDPQWVLAAFKLMASGARKPRLLLKDNSVVGFALGERTRPQFILIDGSWKLYRGQGVQFPTLSNQERINAELSLLSGVKAEKLGESERGEAEVSAIRTLESMGAAVAVNGPEDDTVRTAVLLSKDYRGGDKGLELLGNLTKLEVLIVEDVTGTTDTGWHQIDHLEWLRCFKFLGTPTQIDPITIHLRDLKRLEVVAIGDGGTTDAEIEHLLNSPDLRVLTLYSRKLTDEGLDRLAALKQLRQLSLHAPRGTFSLPQVFKLQALTSGLWVDAE